MPKYTFAVLSNAVEGKDAEFNEWYTNRHVPDVLDVPGFVAAQRFRLTDVQRGNPPFAHRYLALYEIETNDLRKTMDALAERSGTPAMVMSEAFAPGHMALLFEPITPKVEKPR
ncbi:MAG: hypothetical protein J2P47_01850 [Acetobacteraceae bacterium]|nr:hypothetical protein [Acetobacteraceae bacterium]